MAEAHTEHAAARAGTGTLSVLVVTPRGSVLSETADEVTAPGTLGEFGVLPGHIPFLSSLKAGILTHRKGTAREAIAVGPGYLEVGAGDRVEVLVELAARRDEIDAAAVKAEIADINAEIKKGVAQGPDYDALQARLDWALARLTLVSH